jgi:HEAT repeat protein
VTDSQAAYEIPHSRDDPRSVGELISAILSGPDEDLAWDAIGALHWRGTDEVLDRAVRLCQSFCRVERRAGADILGQLGIPDRTFPEPCLRTLLSMLEGEDDHDVIQAILVALSHLRMPGAIVPASRFRHHPDPDVRHGVVLALTGHEEVQALGVLIELTRDPEAHVRDWAAFALGSQVDVNTSELREALVERLSDEDDDTRGEALIGLARRGDRRVLPALREELASDSVGMLTVEAAALMSEPSLHTLLVALQAWWDVDEDLLGEAVRACSPNSGSPAPGTCNEVG